MSNFLIRESTFPGLPLRKATMHWLSDQEKLGQESAEGDSRASRSLVCFLTICSPCLLFPYSQMLPTEELGDGKIENVVIVVL